RITSGHVAFVLAPRINAAGRMGNAEQGLRLLLARDQDEAQTIARSLEEDNLQRRKYDEKVLEEAIRQVEEEAGYPDCSSILLWSDHWHPGVIGIVASRLVERFQRPTILVAIDGDKGRGSGRSLPGLDLTRLLDGCGDLLLAHGGHAFAAGLSVRSERLPELRQRLERLGGGADPPGQVVPPARGGGRPPGGRWAQGGGGGAAPPASPCAAWPTRGWTACRRWPRASTCGSGRATTAARSRRSASAWATGHARSRAPGARTWRSCRRATNGPASRACS